jgi:hypothetical protein
MSWDKIHPIEIRLLLGGERMTDQQAIKFVKEYAEIYHEKSISQMSEGEKDEVVVPFREDNECYLLGRIYPFDDEDEPMFEDGVMFQVECNYHIEDYRRE